jgi:glucose-6-phosphate isomerase
MARSGEGGIANPDENRMVGHYWLRNPALAPTPEIRKEIEETTSRIKDFAGKVHTGEIRGQGGAFKNYLLIGIGGSALGLNLSPRPWATPAPTSSNPVFLTTPIPTAWTGYWQRLATI